MIGSRTEPAVTIDGPSRTWRATPAAATAIRLAVAVAPLLFTWTAVRFASPWFYRPAGRVGVAWWVLQAVPLGVVVSAVVDRVARRLLSLAFLLDLALLFPDQAPSRFAVALRTGTVSRLRDRSVDARRRGLGDVGGVGGAAARAVELLATVGHHDRATRGHTERVRAYSDRIAAELGLTADERAKLAWGALLHDVGKLTVPASILNKADRPSDVEWAIIEQHPAAGDTIVTALRPWLGEWTGAASDHHERWDGSGYPRQLHRDEISPAGRIVAVADAYDVMTSARSYKRPLDRAAAHRELVACAGSQFDPTVVRAFVTSALPHRRRFGRLGWLLEMIRTSSWVSANGRVVSSTVLAVGGTLAIGPVGQVDPPAELYFADTAAAFERLASAEGAMFDSVVYRVCDRHGRCGEATVTIEVTDR